MTFNMKCECQICFGLRTGSQALGASHWMVAHIEPQGENSVNCDHNATYCTACISYGHAYGTYPKSCVADEAAGQGNPRQHALNCPCDNCRPDLSTKRANQAFHAELVKLNRNVEGLTGVAATLTEETRAMNRHIETDKWHKRRDEMAKKVEPKKAEGSNEGGLGYSINASGEKIYDIHRAKVGTVYRINDDGTVSQWTKMLGPVTEDEAHELLVEMNVRNDPPLGITPTKKTMAAAIAALEHFARSRGLMP